jgi:PAS domain S-box-containing protein
MTASMPLKKNPGSEASETSISHTPRLSVADAHDALKRLASLFVQGSARGSEAPGESSFAGNHLSTEARYHFLLEQVPAVIFMANLERGVSEVYVSPRIEAALGFSREGWLGDPVRWYGQLHPEDKERWSLEAAEMLRSGNDLRSTYRVLARDGRVVWFQCEARMVRRDDGQPWFIHGAAFDVTDLKQTERDLRESEERFRLLVEGVKDYAILMLDPNGRVLSWNLGAERIKGYGVDEIIGRHYSIFYPAEDVSAGKPEINLRKAAAEGRIEDEGWRVRKDGSRFWADVVITALRNPDGSLRGFAKITRDVTDRKRAEDSVRELSVRLLYLQDQERRHLARELHDSAGQTLSALSMNLALLQQYLQSSADPRISHVLAESLALAEDSSREIRTLSYLLHPPLLDEIGLADTVRWYVQGFTERTKIEVSLQILPSDFERLRRPLELALFRVVQECLTNVYRHSGSQSASVRLVMESDKVLLQVKDQGKGLRADALLPNAAQPRIVGVGVQGMKERVRQLGGTFEICSAHPGTLVEIVLPIATSDASGTASQPDGFTPASP